jgi:hypothetical protein
MNPIRDWFSHPWWQGIGALAAIIGLVAVFWPRNPSEHAASTTSTEMSSTSIAPSTTHSTQAPTSTSAPVLETSSTPLPPVARSSQRVIYRDVNLSVAIGNDCIRYIDLDEPQVLLAGGETLEIWHTGCDETAQYTLTAYEGDAVLTEATPTMDGAACATAVKRAPVDSVGIRVGSSYCVDTGESPVPNSGHRVSRVDVSAADTANVSLVVTTWDVV